MPHGHHTPGPAVPQSGGLMQGMNTQAFYKPTATGMNHTAPVTVLNEGQSTGSSVGLVQRIPSPLTIQVELFSIPSYIYIM